MNPDPAWATKRFVCDQVVVWNNQSWCNKRYDELQAQGLVSTDLDALWAFYEEM